MGRLRGATLLAGLLIALGAARIIVVLPVYTQTFDEPSHLAGGLEAVERGTYRYESLHTPLARSMIALGPYLDGLRLTGHEDVWEEGNSLLYGRGRYVRTLVLARLGIVPFFILASVVLFAWTKQSFGAGPALLALLLFTTTPPVLAHSGLATTDMALVATLFTAVAAFTSWLDRPTLARSALWGAALALAVLSKISALIFFPLCAACAVVLRWTVARTAALPQASGSARADLSALGWIRQGALALVTLAIVVWAGYRFTMHSLLDPTGNPTLVTGFLNRLVGTEGRLHDAAFAIARFPYLPAPELFLGFGAAMFESTRGRMAYILGESRFGGWWYFFPVAIAFKTPLPLLILFVTGLAASIRLAWARANWRYLLPIGVVIVLLVISMPTKIQIGLRHILPVYPFMAITAGVGAWVLASARRARPLALGALVLLLGWQVISTSRAHPDYLAYFNELAGDRPERVLLDSDLDWGQDLWRLDRALREHGADSVQLLYWGTAIPSAHLTAHVERLGVSPLRPGWVAASLYPVYGDSAGRWQWLQERRPVARVGESIDLYFLTPAAIDSITASRTPVIEPARAP